MPVLCSEGLNGFFGPSGPGAGGMAAVMDASMMDVSMATAPTGSDSMEDATMSESGSDSVRISWSFSHRSAPRCFGIQLHS